MKAEFNLSLNLIMHDLKVQCEKSPLLERNRGFKGVCLYTSSDNWQEDELVVGMLSEILPVAIRNPKQTYLCIRDRFSDEEEKAEDMHNILVMLTNKKLAVIFNKLLTIFQQYQQWYLKMMLSTIEQQGFQELMDLSEEMIGNHIDVMDATFKLQAYTRGVEIDDEITENLLKYGYHSGETVDKFLNLRRFEQFHRENDIIVSDDYKLCKYVTLKRVFHRNGKPVLYVVMHCNHREADDSLLDLFSMLLAHIEYYVNQDNLDPSTFAATHQYLRDLLGGRISTVDEAISRASYATIPFQHDYQLYLIAFDDNFNTPIDKLVKDINQNLPFSYVLTYNRRIVILNNQPRNEEREKALHKVLNKLLKRFPCMVGVSNPIQNLWESRVALEQAGCAIEFGSHKRRANESGRRPSVDFYDFEQSVLTLLVAKSYNTSPDLFKNSFMFQAIHTILTYDKAHSSNLYRTLETYLNCNQKATETCEVLHMHRNTILYHIDRIEQLLGVSLSDPEICAKLFLGIRTYETKMIEVLL